MRKTNLIFLLIVILELILAGVFYAMGNSCGSVCQGYSLFNPFGIGAEEGLCIQTCVRTPHPMFYLTFDLFIFTIIFFLFYLIIGKRGLRS